MGASRCRLEGKASGWQHGVCAASMAVVGATCVGSLGQCSGPKLPRLGTYVPCSRQEATGGFDPRSLRGRTYVFDESEGTMWSLVQVERQGPLMAAWCPCCLSGRGDCSLLFLAIRVLAALRMKRHRAPGELGRCRNTGNAPCRPPPGRCGRACMGN